MPLSKTRLLEKGSALVESILVLGVFSLFMGGIPMLGSLIDLKQTTIQASRYSAWEKTVVVELDHIGGQVKERFFENDSMPLNSSTVSSESNNLLWGESNRHNKGAVTIDDTQLRVESVQASQLGRSAYSDVSDIVTKFGRAVGSGAWKEGNPIGNGLVASTVTTAVKPNEYFQDSRELHESTAIFIDGWSAGEDSLLRDRVQGFMPTSKLDALGKFVSKLSFLPMFGDLKNLDKAFGCVKTNIVTPKVYAAVSDKPELTVYQENNGDKC